MKFLFRLIIIAALIVAGYFIYTDYFAGGFKSAASPDYDNSATSSNETAQSVDQEQPGVATLPTTDQEDQPSICYQDHCYQIAIADNDQERRKGLMFIESLPADQGMLFVFETPSNHKFWMKNTKLTLDMIWLDEHFEIVHLNRNTPPCTADPCPSYGPDRAQATYVLELNGGETSDWEVSQKLTIQNFRK